MVTVVGLDSARQRVGAEVCSDAGFDEAKQIDIAGVADGVCAHAESAARQGIQALFDIRLRGEELVFIYEFDPAGDEVSAPRGKNGFGEV